MFERHHARGRDERIGAVDAQGKAVSLQRPDELACGHAALHGDIHVRCQTRTTPHQRGLSAEHVPPHVDGVERRRQIDEQLSGAGRRRHATPPRLADGRAGRRAAPEAWATRAGSAARACASGPRWPARQRRSGRFSACASGGSSTRPRPTSRGERTAAARCDPRVDPTTRPTAHRHTT